MPGSVTRSTTPTDATREQRTHQATQAWNEAHSLLFVCLGNVCRSPFAERLAQGRLGGRRHATSAGHYPVGGRRSPEPALDAAQGFGVDLASHRSRVLSPRMLDDADAVFVFDEQNYEAVISCDRDAAERTHLLGALCHGGPVCIADPYGGPASLYEAVYGHIAGALAAAEGARK